MNNNALKWAAIGAGAWLLYRYLSKPKGSEPNGSESEDSNYWKNQPYPLGEGTPEQEANRPWWQPRQF
jgi:hypothetical protein